MGIFSFLFGPKTPATRTSTVRSCPYSAPYVILDTETTGLSPHADKIIQISAIKYDATGAPMDFYNTYLNPGMHIPAEASKINGITDKMVASAPTADQIRETFLTFLGDDLIIGYNTTFDLKFLDNTFSDAFVGRQYVDALAMARVLLSMPDYKLATVSSHIGFRPSTSFHDSFTDCEAVAAVLHHIDNNLDRWIKSYRSASSSPSQSNLSDYSALSQGYQYWSQGEEQRMAGNIDAAIKLFDQARDAGYLMPVIYESYAKAYRKLKDYEREIVVLDEAVKRFDGAIADSFLVRKERAQTLMQASQEREQAEQQRAIARKNRAEQRLREREAEANRPRKPIGHPVIQCSDDGVEIRRFDSVTAAAQEFSINSKCIRDAACGRQKHAAGFRWKYASPDTADDDIRD